MVKKICEQLGIAMQMLEIKASLMRYTARVYAEGFWVSASKGFGYAQTLTAQYLRATFAKKASVHNANGIQRNAPLYVIFDHDAGGGSSMFREHYASSLLRSSMSFIIVQYFSKSRHYFLALRSQGCVQYFSTRNLKDVFLFFTALNVERIFINNIINYPAPFSLLSSLIEMSQYGCALDVFIHDYYALCPSYTLINADGVFCDLPPDIAYCQRCIAVHPRIAATATGVPEWRAAWGRFLASADSIIVPDVSVREFILRVYPELVHRILVRPHEPVRLWPPLPPTPKGAPVVVGIIGAISLAKGALVVNDLTAIAERSGAAVSFVVIGALDVAVKRKNCTVTGPYDHANLPALLKKYGITTCLVPSVCPETFCYVAQEIEMLGLPLVCFDLGAQARRARKYAKGYVVPSIDAQMCLDVILSVENSRCAQ